MSEKYEYQYLLFEYDDVPSKDEIDHAIKNDEWLYYEQGSKQDIEYVAENIVDKLFKDGDLIPDDDDFVYIAVCPEDNPEALVLYRLTMPLVRLSFPEDNPEALVLYRVDIDFVIRTMAFQEDIE